MPVPIQRPWNSGKSMNDVTFDHADVLNEIGDRVDAVEYGEYTHTDGATSWACTWSRIGRLVTVNAQAVVGTLSNGTVVRLGGPPAWPTGIDEAGGTAQQYFGSPGSGTHAATNDGPITKWHRNFAGNQIGFSTPGTTASTTIIVNLSYRHQN